MQRLTIEAVIMGLAIGVGAIVLESWVGDSGWPIRIAALIVIGSALCAVQYLLLRSRHKR